MSFTLDAPFIFDFGNLTGTVLFTDSGGGATAFTGSSNRTYSVRAIGEVDEEDGQNNQNGTNESDGQNGQE